MSEAYLETLKSSIFDEYSLRDAIAALSREHALDWHQARTIIVREYDRGLFCLYKDGYENGRHVFLDVKMSQIDFDKDNVKKIYMKDCY